jgi:succinyl-CoA synthetase alpha subunit
MAILVDKSTKVICQGITGSQILAKSRLEIVPADAAKRITDKVKRAG